MQHRISGGAFSNLPNELYFLIADFLKLKDLSSFSRTNTTAHTLLNNTLYKRDVLSADPICLFWASTKNNPSTALKSLAAGFDVNSRTDKHSRLKGCTPILLASVHNSLAVLKILMLNDEALPNSRDRSWTRPPISWAVKQGHTEIVKALLQDDRTDVNLQDKTGDTALMIAVNSQPKMVELLLYSGRADPRITNRQGWTPLSRAARDVYSDVDLLLARHLRLILDGENDAEHCQHVFFYAAIMGQVDIVQYLVNYFGHNLDPNAGGRQFGRGAFSIAAANGRVDVVKFLLEWKSTEPNLQTPWKRQTPLFTAAVDGNEEIVEALTGCERVGLDISDVHGTTPLAAAAETGRGRIVRLLLNVSRPVDPNSVDENGQTPLLNAALFGDLDVVELLLDAPGIDPQFKDSEGRTPLELAEENGNRDIVQAIQKHIAKIS